MVYDSSSPPPHTHPENPCVHPRPLVLTSRRSACGEARGDAAEMHPRVAYSGFGDDGVSDWQKQKVARTKTGVLADPRLRGFGGLRPPFPAGERDRTTSQHSSIIGPTSSRTHTHPGLFPHPGAPRHDFLTACSRLADTVVPPPLPSQQRSRSWQGKNCASFILVVDRGDARMMPNLLMPSEKADLPRAPWRSCRCEATTSSCRVAFHVIFTPGGPSVPRPGGP